MKIIEVRDGFIKFEADKSIYLSSFVRIQGIQKIYIAQVNKLNTYGENSIAVAKLLLIFDNNELKSYDNTEPARDSEIVEYTSDIISNSIKYNSPIIVGKTTDGTNNITIDSSAFDKKMMICVDDKSSNNILVRNLTKQFLNLEKKVAVIDNLGIIEGEKFVAGVDFKLPLDEFSLDFLYESCLNDATEESKKTIIELFEDLKEYSKTVNFVPFDVLKNIVDNMVNKEHIFKLLVLKNKLSKFAELGYFASKPDEVNNLNNILDSDSFVLDLSKLDTLFQNRYLAYIYSKLETKTNVQVFLETSNTVSKTNLKSILQNEKIPTTLITHSKFKYLSDIKNLFDNFIIEPSVTANEVFKIYGNFLNIMKKNSYLITGEATNYIPLISNIQIIDDLIETQKATQLPSTEESEEVNEEIEEIQDSDSIVESVNEDLIIEENTVQTKDDIISNIDDKSDAAISRIAQEIEQPDDLDVFNNDDNENDINSSDIFEEESNEEQEEIETVPDGKNEIETDSEYSGITESDIIEEEDDENYDTSDMDSELAKELDLVETDEDTEDAVEDEVLDIEEDREQTEEFIIEEISDEEMPENISEENTDEQQYTEIGDNLLVDDSAEEEFDNEETEIIDNEVVENKEEIDFSESNEIETEFSETDDNNDTTFVELDENDLDININDKELEEEQSKIAELEAKFEEPTVLPISNSVKDNDDFSEIVELDPSEADENDIVVDMTNDESITVDENAEKKIMEDVDKVYTTLKNDDSKEIEDYSESDLDLIDELNSEDTEVLDEEFDKDIEELPEGDGILEEKASKESIEAFNSEILEKKDSSTPIVPVYDASIPQEDIVMSDPIEQGDNVYHAKYGNGVVEKMIKYGNKSLYSINFENIGRRLLDPTLTEIKKA